MRPASQGDQAHDHVEGGGLAGAVGTEEAHDLPGTHLEGEVHDDLAGTVALAEGFGPEPAHGARSCGTFSGGFLRCPATSFGLMVMRTPPGSVSPGLAATRWRPMSYTSVLPRISFWLSVSQASPSSRTVSLRTSYSIVWARPCASWRVVSSRCSKVGRRTAHDGAHDLVVAEGYGGLVRGELAVGHRDPHLTLQVPLRVLEIEPRRARLQGLDLQPALRDLHPAEQQRVVAVVEVGRGGFEIDGRRRVVGRRPGRRAARERRAQRPRPAMD